MTLPEAQRSPPVAPSGGGGADDLSRRLAELTEAVAARDTFIAVAAHELRNPMTPILGQVELLLSGVSSGKYSVEQIHRRLELIQQSVRRYMKRAAVLLDVSRITTGKFRLEAAPCDLAAVLREVIEDFAVAARHSGVTITLSAPGSLVGLWDRLALEQIFDNLVSNALKYGGSTPVEVSAETDGARARVSIRDHGKGIPADDRRRVFERFERAVDQTEHRSGFGVGLWVVGQLVEAMRGAIEIGDAPGGGALFSVTLPLQAEESVCE